MITVSSESAVTVFSYDSSHVDRVVCLEDFSFNTVMVSIAEPILKASI